MSAQTTALPERLEELIQAQMQRQLALVGRGDAIGRHEGLLRRFECAAAGGLRTVTGSCLHGVGYPSKGNRRRH
jgi:hypothetical protein